MRISGRRVARAVACAIAGMLAAPPALPQGAEPARAETRAWRVSDLAWMAEHWTSARGAVFQEEVWQAPAGDNMLGLWRYMEGGRLRLSEYLMIVQEEQGPVLRLRHFTPAGVGWEEKDQPINLRLARLDGASAVFEGLDRDGNPLSISYTRRGDELFSTLTKASGVTEFRFRRRIH
ncbi:MAG: DUF6265 family protein [Vicinamibacteria bacterium]